MFMLKGTRPVKKLDTLWRKVMAVVLVPALLMPVFLATTSMIECAPINIKVRQAEAMETSTKNNLKDSIEPLTQSDGKIEFIPSVTEPLTYVDVELNVR